MTAPGAQTAGRQLSVVIGAYVLSRGLLVACLFGVFGYPVSVNTDLTLYQEWGHSMLDTGMYPTGEMWQYPPLAALLFVAGVSIAPEAAGMVILTVLADSAIFVLLIRAGRRGDGFGINLRAAWAYVIAGLLIGPVMLGRFDVFPALLALIAVLAVSKPVKAGIALGVGALLKVWPAFLILAMPRRSLAKSSAALLATIIGGLAALMALAPGALDFLKEQTGRGLQFESIGALPYVVANGLGVHGMTEFRFGAVEVNATGAGPIATALTLSSFVLLAAIAYARLRGHLERVATADVALVIVAVSIATSRVFSPQYLIWATGIAALCLLDPKTRMKPVIALLAACAACGQLVFPFMYHDLTEGEVVPMVLHVIKIVLLLTATVWGLVILYQAGQPEPTSDQTSDLGERASTKQ